MIINVFSLIKCFYLSGLLETCRSAGGGEGAGAGRGQSEELPQLAGTFPHQKRLQIKKRSTMNVWPAFG